MENPANNRLVLYPPRFKFVLILIGAILLVAAAFFILSIPDPTNEMIIIGWMGIAFFGSGAIYILYRLIVPKPSIIIDITGIYDNSASVTFGFLRWDQIEKLQISNYRGNKFLLVQPKNLDIFLDNLNLIKRQCAIANIGLIKAPFAIAEQNIPISLEKLISEIKKYSNVKIEDLITAGIPSI